MNELVNLMLGALLPGTTNAPPGATPNAGDTSGSAFQDLLMQTLDGADLQVGADGSWAGQQSSEESTETSKTEASSADQTKLLGSIDMASSVLVAAQAVQVAPTTPVAVDPQPQARASDPVPEVQTVAAQTMESAGEQSADGPAAYAAPVSAEPAVVSPDQQITQSGPDVPMARIPDARADVPMARIPDARADNSTAPVADVQAETAGAPVIDDPVDAALVRTSDAQVNQTASDQTAQTAVVSTDTTDVRPESVKRPNHRRHVPPTPDAHAEVKQADNSDGITTKRGLGLPEIPAPSTGAPAFDYTKLRLNAKLDVKPDDHALLTQSAMPLTRSAVAQASAGDAIAINPVGKQEKLTTGKTVVIPQVAQVSLDTGAALPIEQMAEIKKDAGQDRKEGSLPPTVADVNPSFEKAVAGAERSQGFNAPERVIEHKVINQIVQSARMQLVDGGANMTLRLDPPHLGVLNMSVTAQQGSVVANIQTSTEAARHVLQADLSSLKQALADAGITVDSINVSLGGTPDQPGTPNGGQHAYGNSHGRHVGSPFMQELRGAEPEPMVLSSRTRQLAGVFDYRA